MDPITTALVGYTVLTLTEAATSIGSEMLVGDTIQFRNKMVEYVWGQLSQDPDIYGVLQQAFQEAIYDIGGPHCFPKQYKNQTRGSKYYDLPQRDLPDTDPNPIPKKLHHLPDSIQGQLCQCLTELANTRMDNLPQIINPNISLDESKTQLHQVVMETINKNYPTLTSEYDRWIRGIYPIKAEKKQYYLFEEHFREFLFNRIEENFQEKLKDLPKIKTRYDAIIFKGFIMWFEQIYAQNTQIISNVEQLKRLIKNLDINDQSIVYLQQFNSLKQQLNNLGEIIGSLVIDLSHRIEMERRTSTYDFSETIRFFKTLYQNKTFGGRIQVINQLNIWLSNVDAPPYGMLIASSGRGKSALLFNWQQHYVNQSQYHVIYFPISIRAGTNSAYTFYQALLFYLSQIYNDKETIPSQNPDVLRDKIFRLLQENPPDGKPLLLIIDGLDEALWKIDRVTFPASLPSKLKILISARYQGENNLDRWLQQLGWSKDLVQEFSLPILTEENIRTVFLSAPNKPKTLIINDDLINKISYLSEGEPILVELYINSLIGDEKQGPTLTPEKLQEVKRGLKGYFDNWWKQQRDVWEKKGFDLVVRQGKVDAFLKLCAGAFAPLSQNDLAELEPQQFNSELIVETISDDLFRFVIKNDQQRYFFSHPRLAEYFWEEKYKRAQKEVEQKFLAYGEHVLNGFNSGVINPKLEYEPYTYIIQNYGAHLERAKNDIKIPIPPEQFYTLVSKGWKEAWEVWSGTPTGFLGDVGRAWVLADEHNHWAMQIKCALCFSSVASLSMNMLPELLAMALKHNLYSFTQAKEFIQHTSNEKHKADLIRAIVSSVSLSTTQLQEILKLAFAIEDEGCYAKIFSAPIPQLSLEQQEKLLATALIMKNEEACAEVLSALTPQLLLEQQEKLLATALIMKNEEACAKVLSTLTPQLLFEKQKEVMTKALAMKAEKYCTLILSALAFQMPWEKQEKIMIKAVLMEDGMCCKKILSILGCYLSPDKREEIIEKALVMQDERVCAEVLSALAPYILPERQEKVIAKANSIKREEYSAKILFSLINYLLPENHEKMIASAMLLEGEWYFAEILSALAPNISSEKQEKLLDYALIMEDEGACAEVLSALAPSLLPEKQEVVLARALAIESRQYYIKVLLALIPYLISTRQEKIITNILLLEDERYSVEVLSNLAHHLLSEKREKILAKALAIKDEKFRSWILPIILPHLLPEKREKILALALAMKDEKSCAMVLSTIPAYLTTEQNEEVMIKALSMELERHCAEVLSALAPYLLPEKHKEVIVKALSLKFEGYCAKVLSALAPYLLPEKLEEVVVKTLAMKDEKYCLEVLSALAPRLSLKKQEEVMVKTLVMKSERYYAMVLSALAPHLLPEKHKEVIVKALSLKSERYYAMALSALAPYLSPEKQEEVMVKTLAMKEEEFCAKVLSALAPCLSPEKQEEVMVKTLAMKEEEFCAEVLSAFAPYLSPEKHKEVIVKALSMKFEGYCAKVLSALAPYLLPEKQEEVMVKTLAMKEEEFYAKVLSALASYLPQGKREKIFAKTLVMQDIKLCVMLVSDIGSDSLTRLLEELLSIAPKMNGANFTKITLPNDSSLAPSEIAYILKSTLHDYCQSKRDGLFSVISELLPLLWRVVEEKQKQQVGNEIAEVVFEVTEWWP